MQELNIKEIIKNKDEKTNENINKIMKNFISQQKGYGNTINDEQYHNINKLAELLCCEHKNNTPIIVNIPMGQGKSKLLVEFVRYMYDNDEEFGAIIVKKTLEECLDFALDVDRKDKSKRGLDPKKKNKLYSMFEDLEDEYIVKVVRGFNKKECAKYRNINTYDYRLCLNCKQKCRVFYSKEKSINHRIITITHQRLFNSNNDKNLLEKLLYFNDSNKNIIKRRFLIIDEKIDLVDIRSITINDYNKIKDKINSWGEENYIKQFDDISAYLNSLEYPLSCKLPVKKNDRVFKNDFCFDEELCEYIVKNEKEIKIIQDFFTLEKILGSDSVSLSRSFNPFNSNEITYYCFFSLKEYGKYFDKTIILDATSLYDLEYIFDDIILLKGIKEKKYPLKIYQSKVNMSKKIISSSYETILKDITREVKIITENYGKKTLIVLYKDISIKKFKTDFINEIEKIADEKYIKKYKAIHFGEYTTGTNKFNTCKNMILIGNLNKGSHYYENKCLALGIDTNKSSYIKDTEYLTDAIQQIGRSALRQNMEVNIYMFNADKRFMNMLSQELKVKIQNYKTKHLKIKESAYEKIKDYILKNCIYVGNKIKKKSIKDELSIKKSTYTKAIKVNKLDFNDFLKKNKIKEETCFFQKF